ncbi:MAG: hypothetical protein NTZ13_03385 [Candidatus Parcubacteria bacterium]|nr:hypothetical protein [Candidatus Parcubacteria bacterium]
MSFKEKPWLGASAPKPTTKQENPIQSPEVVAVHEAQKAFMKKYIGPEGSAMAKHEFETLASHARAASKSKSVTAKEREEMKDLAKTVDELWKNR